MGTTGLRFVVNKICSLRKQLNVVNACENGKRKCVFIVAPFQTGMRPLIDPKNEPLTVLMTGITDNRFYKQQSQRQYSINSPNRNELVSVQNKSCFGENILEPIISYQTFTHFLTLDVKLQSLLGKRLQP